MPVTVINTYEEFKEFFEPYAKHYRKELDGKRFAVCKYYSGCDYTELVEDLEEKHMIGWVEDWYQSLVDDSDLEILETFDTLKDAQKRFHEEYSESDFDYDGRDVYVDIYLLVEFDDGVPDELELSKGVLTLEELKDFEA